MNQFDEFMWVHSPNVVKSYYQKQKYENNLSKLIGKKVRTLRPGFGGMGGQILTVISVEPTFLKLEREENGKKIISHSNIIPTHHGVWYFDFEIIEDVKFDLDNQYQVKELHPLENGGDTREVLRKKVDEIRTVKRMELESGKLRPTRYVEIETDIINLSRAFRALLD